MVCSTDILIKIIENADLTYGKLNCLAFLIERFIIEWVQYTVNNCMTDFGFSSPEN